MTAYDSNIQQVVPTSGGVGQVLLKLNPEKEKHFAFQSTFIFIKLPSEFQTNVL
jgi:hypothetical protein